MDYLRVSSEKVEQEGDTIIGSIKRFLRLADTYTYGGASDKDVNISARRGVANLINHNATDSLLNTAWTEKDKYYVPGSKIVRGALNTRANTLLYGHKIKTADVS